MGISMLKSFTRNYEDNSTDAGFQFTFYCDKCQDGYKSEFIESSTCRKQNRLRGLARGVGALGGLFGGFAEELGGHLERGASVLSERFEGMDPEWHREHEAALARAQEEAACHFRRCQACNSWVCDACWNEAEGLCTECAPRQEIYAAKAKSDAMKRNIDEAAGTQTVWSGKLESKTTVCPVCGKPAGGGKFCSGCGATLALSKCPKCGRENAQGARFCCGCGALMTETDKKVCPKCGAEAEAAAAFCAGCGAKL